MDLHNLDCNILYQLGHGWGRRLAPGPFAFHGICRKFADIPPPKVRESLLSLQTGGLVEIQPNPEHVSLTRKAMRRITVSRQCFERLPDARLPRCIGMLCRKGRRAE
jgi:DNA-binding IclR family transcriptional regulator